MHIFNTPAHIGLRRALRRSHVPAERKLWSHLRNRQVYGVKFRRQVSIGPYIVDFYAPSHKLVIEIDGPSHYKEGAFRQDHMRDDYLQRQGLIVVRLRNDHVYNNMQTCIDQVIKHLT